MTLSETTDQFANRPGNRALFSLRGILCALIQLYRWTLSPAQTFLFGAQTGCRFTPTCSQYAMDAIQEHGTTAGSVLAFKRICRCHPFHQCGHDPVPLKIERPLRIR